MGFKIHESTGDAIFDVYNISKHPNKLKRQEKIDLPRTK